jgi:hypothetical protein
MKTLLFVAASALALGVSACGPATKPDARAALDCPASQGDLTRTSQAADGKTCIYTSNEGAEVTLQLIPVKGDAAATLQGIENTIAPAPGESAKQAADTAKAAADTAKDSVAAAKDAADAAHDAARDAALSAKQAAEDAGASAAASVSVGGKGDWNSDEKAGVDVNIGGKNGVSASESDTTRVDLPGIHISARDDNADVRIGGIRINADDDQSTIHIFRQVRLRGEALSREKRGIRATFIAANKGSDSVYRYVGYEAAGPKTGPITVAIVKAKTEIDHDDDVARDVRRLVRRNGGA